MSQLKQQQKAFEDQLEAQRKGFEARIREQQEGFEARIRVQHEELMGRLKMGQKEVMARMEKLESAAAIVKEPKPKKSVNFSEMVGLIYLSLYNTILFATLLMTKVRQPSALLIHHSMHHQTWGSKLVMIWNVPGQAGRPLGRQH